jgi:CBS domain-containing protein
MIPVDAMRADEIMRHGVPAVPPDATVEHVAELMLDENVGFVPIVDGPDSRRLVGVVTDRDLVLQVLAHHRDPRATPIGEVMTRELVTCSPEDELAEVERKMAAAEVRRLPVVDEDGCVLGVVSLHDVVQKESPDRAGLVFREVSKPSAQV